MAEPYITDTDIRQYLDQVPEGTEADDTLALIGERGTSIVNAALGFEFGAYPLVATEKMVRGTASIYLALPAHQLGSVTQVQQWGLTAVVPSESYTELEDGSLLLATPTSAYWVTGSGLHAWGDVFYTVTAKWGYGPVPEAIKEVALEVAINIWKSKDRGMYTDVIGADGGGGLRFVGGLTRQQLAIIDAVRLQYAGRLFS